MCSKILLCTNTRMTAVFVFFFGVLHLYRRRYVSQFICRIGYTILSITHFMAESKQQKINYSYLQLNKKCVPDDGVPLRVSI